MQKERPGLTLACQLLADCLRVVFQIPFGLYTAVEVGKDIPYPGWCTVHQACYYRRVHAALVEKLHKKAARIHNLLGTAAGHYRFLRDFSLMGDQGKKFGKDSALTHICFQNKLCNFALANHSYNTEKE